MFVNFLPTTIYRPEVCLATTERAAEQAGLRLDQLVFEVTESEQVNDLDHLEKVFSYYRERGCKVALDDLGAGYSSLNMLVRLKPDIVKLDNEMVQRLPELVSRSVVGGRRDHPRLRWSGPGRVRRDRRAGRRRTGAGGRPGPRLVLRPHRGTDEPSRRHRHRHRHRAGSRCARVVGWCHLHR